MADSFWGDDEETKKQKAYEQGLQDDARADPDGFLNLQRYVGVNEGKGLEMAHLAASQVQSQAEDLKGDVNSAKNEFNTAKNAGSVESPYAYAQGTYQTPSDAAFTVVGSSGGAGGKGGINNLERAPPTERPASGRVESGDGHIITAAEAKAQSERGYTGPTGLTDDNFASRSKETGDFADDVASGEGLASRASQIYGKGAEGSYGAGKSAYDAMLAGATGGGELSAIQSKYGGLEKYVTDEQAAATAAATAAADSSKANATAFGQMVQPLQDAEDFAAAEADKNRYLKSSYLGNYKRGDWGQIDPFGASDAKYFEGSNDLSLGWKGDYPGGGNAESAYGAELSKITPADYKAIYQGMSDDEYREWRWIVEGKDKKGNLPGNRFDREHPDTVKSGRAAAIKKFMSKMMDRYVTHKSSKKAGF